MSFQSKEVLDILLSEGEYHPSYAKSREGRDYNLEKSTYGFEDVIWCFSPICCNTVVENKFTKDDFINGSLFFNFKCEMSLASGENLNDLVLMELEYDRDDIKLGLTHNGCSYANVVPTLSMDNLVAIYRLNYDDDSETRWFYPEVFVESIYKEEVLFKEDFECKKVKKIK